MPYHLEISTSISASARTRLIIVNFQLIAFFFCQNGSESVELVKNEASTVDSNCNSERISSVLQL